MNTVRTQLAAIALATAVLPVSGKTILLDVQAASGGDAPAPTAADFMAYDPAVSPSATPEVVTSWADLGAKTLTDEDGATYSVTTEGGSRGPATSGSAAWNDMEPILESYFYTSNATEPSIVTITGVEQFPAGELITLTVFGIGDNAGQGSTFAPTYAGTTYPAKLTTQGTNQGVETDSSRSAQWQFTSDGLSTTLSFSWDRNVNRYAALNGFSITSSSPSFGTIESLALTPETSTSIVGGPDIPLTAIGSFTGGEDSDVTTVGATFESSDTGIITVSSSGVVTIVGAGVATITATFNGDNSSTASDVSTFNIEAPTSLSVTATDPILLQNGYTTDLSVTASSASFTDLPIDGYTGLSFASSDTEVADVDPVTGVVTPLDADGSSTITATLAGVDGTQEINVEAPTSIIASVPRNDLFLGGSGVTITVTASSESLTDIDLSDLADQGVLFFLSEDYDVIDVDELGNVLPSDFAGETNVEVSFAPAPEVLVPFTVTEPTPKPTTLIHRYSFNGTGDAAAPESSVIEDSQGGANGMVIGTGAVYDPTGTRLVLPGGADDAGGAYVDLPNGMISTIPNIDTVGLTIEVWMTRDVDDSWMRAFDFGNNVNGEDMTGYQTSTLDVIPRRSGGGAQIATELTLSRGDHGTQFLQGGSFAMGELAHIVLSVDGETGGRRLYLNGDLSANDQIDLAISTLSQIDDVNCWLGRSNAGDNRLGGSFDEVRIHTGIMTDEQVMQSFIDGPDAGFGGTSYDEWSTLYAGGEGSELDFDKDGMLNGVEYFMGETNDPVFTPNPVIVDGKVTWPKSSEFLGTYSVQTSPNLLDWTDRSSTVVGSAIEYLVTDDPEQRFIRLNVTPTPAAP